MLIRKPTFLTSCITHQPGVGDQFVNTSPLTTQVAEAPVEPGVGDQFVNTINAIRTGDQVQIETVMPTVSDASGDQLLSETPRAQLHQPMKHRRFYKSSVTKQLASEPASSCRVSVLELSPYPRAESNVQIRKRRAQKAEIITSSPFKAIVEQQETLKNAKNVKQAEITARASSKKLKQMQKVEVRKASSHTLMYQNKK